METFLICLILGVLIGRLGIVGFLIDEFIMWYQNKYGNFTSGGGRNYLQIFKTPIEVK